MKERYLADQIYRDLNDKMVILSGPRQCGKTTLSKDMHGDGQYLNFDAPKDREIILKMQWDRQKPLVIFDELHKMKKWKSWLKGVYDTEGNRPRILVTGSARMTQFKKTGDSLAGRHFNYRLHPFDLHELKAKSKAEQKEIFNTLIEVGGFPEPFLKGEKKFYNRWRASHLDLILRQDLLDLEPVRDLKSIEILVQLLSERVGTPVSTAALARMLQKDPKTITHWLEILEDLFVIFRVTPFHKNIARSILKEPKFYFYDTGIVKGDEAIRFENLTACSLLKEVQRLQDVEGIKGELKYLRTKESKEIDFLVHFEENPAVLVEAKWADENLSGNFKHFSGHFKNARKVQLVAQLRREKTTPDGCEVREAAGWLTELNLIKG